MRDWNYSIEGLLNEWLKLWQIREEQEATDSGTEQEVPKPNHGPVSSVFPVTPFSPSNSSSLFSKQDDYSSEDEGVDL